MRLARFCEHAACWSPYTTFGPSGGIFLAIHSDTPGILAAVVDCGQRSLKRGLRVGGGIGGDSGARRGDANGSDPVCGRFTRTRGEIIADQAERN